MAEITQVSFVRHGNVHNPEKILYGRLPRFRLSSRGEADAKKASNYLKNVSLDAVYASPMLRAKQTARIILQNHPGLKIKTSVLINEVSTLFEGKPEKELSTVSGDVYHGKIKGYEQPEEILARALQFISRIRKHYHSKHVAVVTHGDVILFLLFWTMGIDVTAKNKLRLDQFEALKEYPCEGSITRLTYHTKENDERPRVSYISPG